MALKPLPFAALRSALWGGLCPPSRGRGAGKPPPVRCGVFVPPSVVRRCGGGFIEWGGSVIAPPGSALTPKPPPVSVCPSKITYLLTKQNICSVNVLNHSTTICTKYQQIRDFLCA